MRWGIDAMHTVASTAAQIVVILRHPDAWAEHFRDGFGARRVRIWSDDGPDKEWIGTGRTVQEAWVAAGRNLVGEEAR